MLGKINAETGLMVLDEQIEVEFNGETHVVDLKFTRNNYIKFMNLMSQYDEAVLNIIEGGYTSLEDIDKEFSDKVLDYIDLSFITGENEVVLRISTIIAIKKKLLEITPK